MNLTDPYHSVSLSGILLGLDSHPGLGMESTPSLYSMLTSTTKANIIFEFSSAALNQPPCFLQQSESMTTALQYSLLCDLLKNSWS